MPKKLLWWPKMCGKLDSPTHPERVQQVPSYFQMVGLTAVCAGIARSNSTSQTIDEVWIIFLKIRRTLSTLSVDRT